MQYIRLYNSADDPQKQQLGIGVLVEYGPGELNSLLHVLRFITKYGIENVVAENDLPKAVVTNTYVTIENCLRTCAAVANSEGDIVAPIHIYFLHEHQLLFRAYLGELEKTLLADEESGTNQDEEENAVKRLSEYILAHYINIERQFFPKKQLTH